MFNVKNKMFTLQSLMGFCGIKFKFIFALSVKDFEQLSDSEKEKMWIRELIELAVFFFFIGIEC